MGDIGVVHASQLSNLQGPAQAVQCGSCGVVVVLGDLNDKRSWGWFYSPETGFLCPDHIPEATDG